MKNEPRMLLSSIDIIVWAISQRRPLTRDAIRARWGVGKATAYRWLPTLEEARQRVQILGIAPAPQYTRRPVAESTTEARA